MDSVGKVGHTGNGDPARHCAPQLALMGHVTVQISAISSVQLARAVLPPLGVQMASA